MSPVRRTVRLLRLLREPVALSDLTAQLAISEPALRRMLADLRAEGVRLAEFRVRDPGQTGPGAGKKLLCLESDDGRTP